METLGKKTWKDFKQNFAIGDSITEKRFRIAFKVGKQTKSIAKRYNENNKMDVMQQMLIIQNNLIHKI